MIGETAGQHGLSIIAPPADRRLTQRLIEVWLRTARGRFPSWTDMRRVDLGDDWNWVFVVDLKLSLAFPHFIYLGSRLQQLSSVYLATATDFSLSLLDEATATINLAVGSGAPRQSSNELMLADGRKVLFRSMTAPLADDGETISHVVGCAFGRVEGEAGPALRVV
ncbi:MAG: hypothetical protein ACKVS5_15260 [Parvularculaceae bacterium]